MKTLILLCALALAVVTPAFAQKKAKGKGKTKEPAPTNNASPVPKFTFAETRAEQEKQLATNPLLARFRESRAKLLQDPHHPLYHFVSPENRLNDPNGLSFWNGQWHMFYQGYPDGKGGVVVIFNVNEGKPTKGWNRMMSLRRTLTLRTNSVFNPLNIEPAGDVQSLRGEHVRVGAMNLPANKDLVLEQVKGNAMELIAEIAPQSGQTIELNVLRASDGEEVTRIQCYRDRGMRIMGPKGSPAVVSIDTSRSTVAGDVRMRPAESAQVDLAPDEPLRLRVFIDRSIVEVFVNGRQSITVRAYPDRKDSVGVSLRAQGTDAKLISLDAWQMKSIYP